MKHFDNPSLNLAMGVMALMNQSDGTIEDIAREALNGICCFLQNQGNESDCGGLNSTEGFAKAAGQEYKELIEFRAEMEVLDSSFRNTKSSFTKEVCSTCSGTGVEYIVCDQGHYGFSQECSDCNSSPKKADRPHPDDYLFTDGFDIE